MSQDPITPTPSPDEGDRHDTLLNDSITAANHAFIRELARLLGPSLLPGASIHCDLRVGMTLTTEEGQQAGFDFHFSAGFVGISDDQTQDQATLRKYAEDIARKTGKSVHLASISTATGKESDIGFIDVSAPTPVAGQEPAAEPERSE